jgi:signal transduction histidine kinase
MSNPAGIDIFAAKSEMADRIRAFDWSKTSLGPPEQWSEVLKMSVSLCLNSRFPLILWWGPELTMLYNDPYREHLQSKHPAALGKPGSQVWSEIWNVIGPMLDGVVQTGEPTWSDDLLLFLERNGYPEETYHTFSYSAIKDTTGKIVGIFTPVAETTQRVVGERRLSTLREIARKSSDGEVELCAQLARVLESNTVDLPSCALFDLRDENSEVRCLIGATANLSDDSGQLSAGLITKIKKAVTARAMVVIADLDRLLPNIGSSKLGLKPRSGVLVPVPAPQGGWFVFFSAISPHLPFDDNYRSFLEAVTRELSTALKEARALEQERRRAQMLMQLDQAKTEFFSNVSHEFRTPLTLMLGPLDNCLERADDCPDEVGPMLQVIKRNAQRLQRLVNSLLDFSRIEAGRIDGVFTETDLSVFTKNICSSFTSLMNTAGLDFSVDCDPNLPPVFVDTDMWEKIVLNLISNAFKFTESGGVEITLLRVEGFAQLSVKDSGVGIPKAELPNVFKRFHRIKNSFARTHEGSGIGLALVKELVEIHGGMISVNSSEKGSEFIVRIPLGSTHVDPARLNSERALASTAISTHAFVDEAQRWLGGSEVKPAHSGLSGRPKPSGHILVADDNADMRDYVAKILADNWTITCVANGAEALTELRTHIPDLVVSDIMMPKMDGFELLQAIRTDPRWTELPVILLSARAGEEATVDGLNAGATDYLVKPFSAKELVARVSSALEASKTDKIAALQKELQALAHLTSHEMQDPVRTIKSYQRLLAVRYKNRLGEDADEFIEQCVRAAETIDRMVQDLWVYSSIGELQQEYTEVDTTRALGSALAQLAVKIQEHNAVIQHSTLPKVYAAEEQIIVLFRNLIDNAISFGAGPVKVNISAQSTESEWLFSVEDNGPGIDPMNRSKIFSIFTRGNGKPSGDGSGMGLPICRRIVETLGGKMWVDANGAGGATFFFSLPRIDIKLEH